jgi:cytoskeletal protein CcmA (bactofilin family)
MHTSANNTQKNINPPDIKSEEQVAVIGKLFEFKGNLSGTGAVILSGKIEGNILATQVIVEKEAHAVGDISCQQIDISGHVQGMIEVVDAVIRTTAIIEGDLHYSSIAIESGGRIIGRLKQVQKKITPNDGKPPKEFTQIAFPVELAEKLRTHESRMAAYLSAIDGSPPPEWIKLNQDRLGLTANSIELKRLKDAGSQMGMRLHIGSQYFDFNLPA